MQHFQVTAQGHLDLQTKNTDTEKQVQQLLVERSNRDSTFTTKEVQLFHFQGLFKRHEAELIHRQELVRAEGALKDVECRMVDYEKEVAELVQKES